MQFAKIYQSLRLLFGQRSYDMSMEDVLVATMTIKGGSIKAFMQLRLNNDNQNCTINSARWLRHRAKNGDFIRKYGTHVKQQMFTKEGLFEPDKNSGYTVVGKVVDNNTEKSRIMFNLHRPSDDYFWKTNKKKELTTIPMGMGVATDWDKLSKFVEGGAGWLQSEEKNNKLILRKVEVCKNVQTHIEDDRKTLTEILKKSGYFLGDLQGKSPHAIAFFVTAEEMWMFDPSIGELKVPIHAMNTWFEKKAIIDYLTVNRYALQLTKYEPTHNI